MHQLINLYSGQIDFVITTIIFESQLLFLVEVIRPSLVVEDTMTNMQ